MVAPVQPGMPVSHPHGATGVPSLFELVAFEAEDGHLVRRLVASFSYCAVDFTLKGCCKIGFRILEAGSHFAGCDGLLFS